MQIQTSPEILQLDLGSTPCGALALTQACVIATVILADVVAQPMAENGIEPLPCILLARHVSAVLAAICEIELPQVADTLGSRSMELLPHALGNRMR
jgi:hypothetical protein